MRARTNVDDIARDVIRAVERMRPVAIPHDEDAWAEIETFIAIALRVMAKTNPSKVRDIAMTVEIQAHMRTAKLIPEPDL